MLYAPYGKLSKELKNSIKISSRPSSSWVINENDILTVLIPNLEDHLVYQNFNAIFEFLGQFASKMHKLFFQKGFDNFEIEQHANFWSEVKYILQDVWIRMKETTSIRFLLQGTQ